MNTDRLIIWNQDQARLSPRMTAQHLTRKIHKRNNDGAGGVKQCLFPGTVMVYATAKVLRNLQETNKWRELINTFKRVARSVSQNINCFYTLAKKKWEMSFKNIISGPRICLEDVGASWPHREKMSPKPEGPNSPLIKGMAKYSSGKPWLLHAEPHIHMQTAHMVPFSKTKEDHNDISHCFLTVPPKFV